MAEIETKAEFPEALQGLFLPNRYKVFYGGRGGTKSWGCARALAIMGAQRPLRILCAREFQNSIRDSVHRLISDQIHLLGLDNFYRVEQARILGANGTEFSFEGIRHNISKIRSYEGVDICWVEEANLTTAASWDVLIPTIRKESSEIWITFNPELDTDETYQRFVINAEPSWLVKKVSWRDNPWFSAVMRAEMEHLKAKNFDAYMNVWEGHTRVMLDGAIFADEIKDAEAEGRICEVKYDESVPVDTFWDLGHHDQTSIWFAQRVGQWYNIIDFFQYQQKKIPFYLKVLQKKQYVYGTFWLPHDAHYEHISAELSTEAQIKKHGFKVRIVPKLSKADGINAARTVFPQARFDKGRTKDGMHSLRHYRYEVDPETKRFSREPLHDWASDAADAFRYLAVAMKAPKPPKEKKERIRYLGEMLQPLGWMG